MFSSWIISTIRAQETVDATSPAAVLAKLEREDCKRTHGKNGVPALPAPTPLPRLLVEALVGSTTWRD